MTCEETGFAYDSNNILKIKINGVDAVLSDGTKSIKIIDWEAKWSLYIPLLVKELLEMN